jgi:hypothetical protein
MHWRDIHGYRVLSVDTKLKKVAMFAHPAGESAHIWVRC